MIKILPAIMSGGSGTRLWPLSTPQRPKQFHALGSAVSMIAETALRLRGEIGGIRFLDPIAIASAPHAEIVEAELAAVGVPLLRNVLEPEGRNTAATAALAAAAGLEIDPDALVLLAPADHVIADAEGFRAAIARAAPYARERILTFGIAPDRPETGFGYIQAGEELGDGVCAIAAFKEKPIRTLAESYLAQGGYYWNAGIFLFAPQILLEEFGAHPDIRDRALAAYAAAGRDGARVNLGAEFALTPSEPIDIAVMENTKRGAVAPVRVGWADLGSWAELWRLSPQDEAGNAAAGPVALKDCAGLMVRAEGVTVAACGVEDLIIVATRDAVLVIPKSRAQDVKAMVEAAAKLKSG